MLKEQHVSNDVGANLNLWVRCHKDNTFLKIENDNTSKKLDIDFSYDNYRDVCSYFQKLLVGAFEKRRSVTFVLVGPDSTCNHDTLKGLLEQCNHHATTSQDLKVTFHVKNVASNDQSEAAVPESAIDKDTAIGQLCHAASSKKWAQCDVTFGNTNKLHILQSPGWVDGKQTINEETLSRFLKAVAESSNPSANCDAFSQLVQMGDVFIVYGHSTKAAISEIGTQLKELPKIFQKCMQTFIPLQKKGDEDVKGTTETTESVRSSNKETTKKKWRQFNLKSFENLGPPERMPASTVEFTTNETNCTPKPSQMVDSVRGNEKKSTDSPRPSSVRVSVISPFLETESTSRAPPMEHAGHDFQITELIDKVNTQFGNKRWGFRVSILVANRDDMNTLQGSCPGLFAIVHAGALIDAAQRGLEKKDDAASAIGKIIKGATMEKIVDWVSHAFSLAPNAEKVSKDALDFFVKNEVVSTNSEEVLRLFITLFKCLREEHYSTRVMSETVIEGFSGKFTKDTSPDIANLLLELVSDESKGGDTEQDSRNEMMADAGDNIATCDEDAEEEAKDESPTDTEENGGDDDGSATEGVSALGEDAITSSSLVPAPRSHEEPSGEGDDKEEEPQRPYIALAATQYLKKFSKFDDDAAASLQSAQVMDGLCQHLARLVSVLRGEAKCLMYDEKNYRINQAHTKFLLDGREGKPFNGRLHGLQVDSLYEWRFLPEGWDLMKDSDLEDLFQTKKNGIVPLRAKLMELAKTDSRNLDNTSTWPKQITSCDPAKILLILSLNVENWTLRTSRDQINWSSDEKEGLASGLEEVIKKVQNVCRGEYSEIDRQSYDDLTSGEELHSDASGEKKLFKDSDECVVLWKLPKEKVERTASYGLMDWAASLLCSTLAHTISFPSLLRGTEYGLVFEKSKSEFQWLYAKEELGEDLPSYLRRKKKEVQDLKDKESLSAWQAKELGKLQTELSDLPKKVLHACGNYAFTGLLHGDIKMSNLLVVKRGKDSAVVLFDHETAVPGNELAFPRAHGITTLEFARPEDFFGPPNLPCNHGSDDFCMALVMLQLALQTDKDPYSYVIDKLEQDSSSEDDTIARETFYDRISEYWEKRRGYVMEKLSTTANAEKLAKFAYAYLVLISVDGWRHRAYVEEIWGVELSLLLDEDVLKRDAAKCSLRALREQFGEASIFEHEILFKYLVLTLHPDESYRMRAQAWIKKWEEVNPASRRGRHA